MSVRAHSHPPLRSDGTPHPGRPDANHQTTRDADHIIARADGAAKPHRGVPGHARTIAYFTDAGVSSGERARPWTIAPIYSRIV